jgi:hypothetical protein
MVPLTKAAFSKFNAAEIGTNTQADESEGTGGRDFTRSLRILTHKRGIFFLPTKPGGVFIVALASPHNACA